MSRISLALTRRNRAKIAPLFGDQHSFTPDQISGLQLWLETHARNNPLLNLTTDTAGLVQAVDTNAAAFWRDRSPSKRHFTATAKPVVEASGARHSLTFTAASAQFMVAAAAAPFKCLHDGTGGSAFVLYNQLNENLGVLLDTGGNAGATNVGAMIVADDSSTNEGRLTMAICAGAGAIVNIAGPAGGNSAYPVGTWHIAEFSYKEGALPTEALLFGDGAYVIGGDSSSAPSVADPTGALRVGLDIDGASANAFAFGGSVGAVVVYNRVLSTTEKRLVRNYLAQGRAVTLGNVALMGDSILGGDAAPVTIDPVTQIQAALGTGYKVTDFCISGARIDSGTPDVNTEQWLAQARRRGFNIIVTAMGINDCRNAQAAATSYTEAQAIYNSVLADPENRLIITTIMPFNGDSAYSAPNEAIRQTLNGNLRTFAAANANTYLLDMDVIARDGSDVTLLRPEWDYDHLHLNQVGSTAFAALVAGKVKSIGLN